MAEDGSRFHNDILTFALIALLVVVPIRWFIAQPFVVQGGSMEPTFHSGEYLIIDQLTYRLEEPQRGDVIILKYPRDESVYFIKRIIGLPGEVVALKNGSVTITRDGAEPFVLPEPYVPETDSRTESATYVLGPDEYFVMGDNRSASSDSRVWGPLPERDIVGRAFVRLFPPDRLSFLPGNIH